MGILFTPKPPIHSQTVVLLCQGKAGDGKQSLWVVPFLRTQTPRTHCKVCWQEKSSFFSTQPALLLSSPFCSVACLWLPESMQLPSYILKGLLRNPPVFGFFILLSLFTFECQSASFSPCICLYLSKKYFCIPLFSFCFSHSIPPAHFSAALLAFSRH